MHFSSSDDLYAIILRGATLPVLILLLVLAWFIANMVMNQNWRQSKRNREIRKAVAEREARLAARKDEEDNRPA